MIGYWGCSGDMIGYLGGCQLCDWVLKMWGDVSDYLGSGGDVIGY